MASPCWMALTLALMLSAGNCLAVINLHKLADIVMEILNMYRPSYEVKDEMRFPMFSVAVSVPYDSESKMFDISGVTDSGNAVRETILKCRVYSSSRVVAATVLRWPNVTYQCPYEPAQWPDVLTKCGQQRRMTWLQVKERCNDKIREGRADHAEYRTLQHFDSLKHQDRNDLLVFYVLASPCERRCASQSSPWSILRSIRVIKNWTNYAVVFSNIFRPLNGHGIPEADRRAALQRLGEAVGLNNVFRCRERGGKMTCTSCLSESQVAQYCVSERLH